MPTLAAIQPDDGFSLVREDEALFFIGPPFDLNQREMLPNSALLDALRFHGYERRYDPEEPWKAVVERIQKLMVEAYKPSELPSQAELLRSLLQCSPVSVLHALMDRIESQWLPNGDVKSAQRALDALFAEMRVSEAAALLERASNLRKAMRDERSSG